MFNLGLGSPVGVVGGTFAFSPWAPFQLELGLGLGFSGFQFSAMPKLLSLGSAEKHFALGAGPSVGIGQGNISYWLNAEAGYEIRSQGGLSFLIAFGVVSGLAGKMRGYHAYGDEEPGVVAPESVSQIVLPEFRIAWGHWWK